MIYLSRKRGKGKACLSIIYREKDFSTIVESGAEPLPLHFGTDGKMLRLTRNETGDPREKNILEKARNSETVHTHTHTVTKLLEKILSNLLHLSTDICRENCGEIVVNGIHERYTQSESTLNFINAGNNCGKRVAD